MTKKSTPGQENHRREVGGGEESGRGRVRGLVLIKREKGKAERQTPKRAGNLYKTQERELETDLEKTQRQ